MNGAVKRDAALVILLGAACVLVLFNGVAALLYATSGMAFFGMVKAGIWLTGAFAIVGAAFGLRRATRHPNATARLARSHSQG